MEETSLPQISITDLTVTEDLESPDPNFDSLDFIFGLKSVSFTLELSEPAENTVTVNYTTVEDTASFDNEPLAFATMVPRTNFAPADYVNSQGVVEFAPGETQTTIEIKITDDIFRESTETFFIDLYRPINATLADDRAIGTIEDESDSVNYAISLSDVDVNSVVHFFNSEIGTSLYTSEPIEIEQIRAQIANGSSRYEDRGEVYRVLDNNVDPITGIELNGTPVYRFQNLTSGSYLYTVDELEKTSIEDNLTNYAFEGVAYYAIGSSGNPNPPEIPMIDIFGFESTPLFRLYSSELDRHVFTTSIAERDELLTQGDYQLEVNNNGVAFYVFPSEVI